MRFGHISDIHIKLNSRVDEYKYIFEKLYKMLSLESLDRIVITGDLFHNKTNLSPESINLVADFLLNLSKIANVDLIAGNHDIGKIYDRLDSIEPIVLLLNDHSLLHEINYMKTSGIYKIDDNHQYVLYDFRDKDYTKFEKSDNKISIGLYHGIPYKLKTNFTEFDPNIDSRLFENLDYAFFGDIHQVEYFNAEKTFVMAGSLIQQSHSETVDGHGYHVYDTISKTHNFLEVENDYYGFIEINDSNIKIIDAETIELIMKDYNFKDASVKVNLQKTYTINQLVHLKSLLKSKFKKDINVSIKIGNSEQIKSISINNISDVNIQNQLIIEYCKLNKINDVDEILKINNDINSRIKLTDFNYFIKWEPISMRWSNLFSFGETENSIDFSKLKGVTGILGLNAHGKSNIFHILLLALYANTPKISKLSDAINSRKNNAYVELKLKIDGKEYKIYREFIKKAKTVSSTLSFQLLDESSQKYISIDGDTSTDTKKIISKHIGNYDDIITSTFSLQGDEASFLKKGESERKEFIYNYIGLNIFDKLYKESSKNESAYDGIINQYKNIIFENEILKLETEIKEIENSILESDEKIIKIENLIEKYNNSILNDTNELEKLNENKKLISKIDILKDEISDIKNKISNNDRIKLENKNKLNIVLSNINELKKINLKSEIDDLNDKLIIKNKIITEKESLICENTLKVDGLKKSVSDNDDINNKILKLKNKINELDFNIKSYKRQTEILEKQPWMSEIEQCKKCILSKDAFESFDKMSDDIKLKSKSTEVIDKLLLKYNENLNSDINSIDINVKTLLIEKQSNLTDVEKINNKIKDLELIDSKIDKLNSDSIIYESNITSLNDKNNKLSDDLSLKETELIKYNSLNDELIKINTLETSLKTQKDNRDKCKVMISTIRTDISKQQSSVGYKNGEISGYETKKRDYEKALKNKFIYKNYRDIINKNGLPLETLKKFIPMLNNTISNYLIDLVDFNVTFEMDDDKMRILISNSTNNIRDVRCASGMEITLMSWIIRACLSEFSILPKSNLFIIDEGFGANDQDHLSNMNKLFDKLKVTFDKILIVSHIPQVADFTDNLIEVKKDSDNYSYLQ